MLNPSRFEPWWAALTVWVIVNTVNLLQAIGFLSRLPRSSRAVNHTLGYVIIAAARIDGCRDEQSVG